MDDVVNFVGAIICAILILLMATGLFFICNKSYYDLGCVFTDTIYKTRSEENSVVSSRRIMIYERKEDGVITLYKEFNLPKSKYIFVSTNNEE